MARELSKYGLSVTLNEGASTVDIEMFERLEGDTKEVVEQRSYKLADIPGYAELSSMALKTALYGLSKFVQDRTSSESKSRDRLSSMDEVFSRLKEEQWEKEREASGPLLSIEVEALALLRGVNPSDIQRALRGYTPEQREGIFANPTVVAKVAELREARQDDDAPAVALDDLLVA